MNIQNDPQFNRSFANNLVILRTNTPQRNKRSSDKTYCTVRLRLDITAWKCYWSLSNAASNSITLQKKKKNLEETFAK